MHSLITSYLLQSKECILPGIGVLQIIHTPASTDAANSRILPPFDGIIFKKEDRSASRGLVQYITGKKHVQKSEAEDLLNNFCKEWKEKIGAGERLHLETVGSIFKGPDGLLTFERDKSFHFFQPITVNKIYQRSEQPVAVAEEYAEPVAPLMPETIVATDVVVERSYWGLWALILLAIGLVVVFYYFKDHKPSVSNIGNQHKYIIDSAGATYQLPK
jgi:nucleoid DNA-binding protein